MALNSRDYSWAGLVQRPPLNRIPEKALKHEFSDSRPVGRHRFQWEKGVKEDAVRLTWCHNRKLTTQNRIVWRQKLGEAKARLWTIVL